MGDLTVLCALRAAINCLVGINDTYLLSNTLAILMDLAPNLHDVSAYAAERIVSVTKRLMRRYIRMIAVINKRRSMARRHMSAMTSAFPHTSDTATSGMFQGVESKEIMLRTDSQ